MTLPDNYQESSFAKRDLLKECMNKYIGPIMLSLPGKVIRLIVYFAVRYLGCSCSLARLFVYFFVGSSVHQLYCLAGCFHSRNRNTVWC